MLYIDIATALKKAHQLSLYVDFERLGTRQMEAEADIAYLP